jgi:Phage tail tube protein
MPQKRVGGMIDLKINGQMYQAKGNFTYNLGHPKKDAVVGAASIHGYTEKPQVPFIEGEITDNAGISLKALTTVTDATIQLTLGNGKILIMSGGWFAGEGTGNTDEGNIGVRFESDIPMDEVK